MGTVHTTICLWAVNTGSVYQAIHVTALSLEALFNRLLGPVIKLAYCVYIIFEIKRGVKSPILN